MIMWPDDLVTDIARRNSVLYIGSGVSANARNAAGESPPTWESFLRVALTDVSCSESKKYIESLLAEKDMLSACEVIINGISQQRFNTIAQDKFRRQRYKPAKIHELIYNLDSRIVLTPNVDKIYDQYATTTSDSTVVVKKYNDSDVASHLKNQDRVILKVHGTIDTPSEMIFSKKQYNEAKYKYSSFYRILDALALTHTYIFLGCGLNDPDIKLTLENYNFWYPECRPHYFISAKQEINADMENMLRDNYNIALLTYDNTDGTHSKLTESLEILVMQVEEKRTEIAGDQNW